MAFLLWIFDFFGVFLITQSQTVQVDLRKNKITRNYINYLISKKLSAVIFITDIKGGKSFDGIFTLGPKWKKYLRRLTWLLFLGKWRIFKFKGKWNIIIFFLKFTRSNNFWRILKEKVVHLTSECFQSKED